MNDRTDSQLLRAYAENRSEAAFTELVRRYVDFVKESVFVTEGARKLAEDMLVQMAEASTDPDRARFIQEVLDNGFGVEEGILMPMMAENRDKGYTGYRILSQESTSAGELILEVETGMISAPAKKEHLKFRHFGIDWKVVIDEEFFHSRQ